jgi:plasmid stability protein
MTMTVKLDPLLERRLRLHAAATGRPASEIIREALVALLDGAPAEPLSAHALGADLFGRYSGPADLAAHRKRHAAEAYAQRHARRGA